MATWEVSSVSDRAPSEYVVEGDDGPTTSTTRPRTAPAFQLRGAGGGGGAGGGRGGLGGRHARKSAADVLPRTMQPLSAEASRNVATRPPRAAIPKANPFKEQAAAPTMFRRVYERGDLPARVNGGVKCHVHWHVGPMSKPASKAVPTFHAAGGPEYEAAKAQYLAHLDYSVYLPLFFDGLREKAEPCRFLAERGTYDLLEAGTYAQVAPTIGTLILPIRQALTTRDVQIISRTVIALGKLVSVPPDPASGAQVGELVAPHFRHLLPIFNLFKSNRTYASTKVPRPAGEAASTFERGDITLGELMDDTLSLLAVHGGVGAAKEINRIVPLWVPPPGGEAPLSLYRGTVQRQRGGAPAGRVGRQ